MGEGMKARSGSKAKHILTFKSLYSTTCEESECLENTPITVLGNFLSAKTPTLLKLERFRASTVK